MWRLEWLESCVDQLTKAWVQADPELRKAITVATHQIDTALITDPQNQGESRDREKRIHVVLP